MLERLLEPHHGGTDGTSAKVELLLEASEVASVPHLPALAASSKCLTMEQHPVVLVWQPQFVVK